MIAAFYLLYFYSALPYRTKRYFLFGYLFYGIAAICSATRHIGDWYAVVGGHILNFLNYEEDISLSGDLLVDYHNRLGLWFMELIFEESPELIASTLLLCGLLHFFNNTGSRKSS